MNWQKISVIIGIIVGLFTIGGGFIGAQQYMEKKYARAETVQQIQIAQEYTNKRLEQKIITDRILSLEERKDRIELKSEKTQEDKERIKEYERDIHELEIHLNQLDKTE